MRNGRWNGLHTTMALLQSRLVSITVDYMMANHIPDNTIHTFDRFEDGMPLTSTWRVPARRWSEPKWPRESSVLITE
jgi:hypothetical protein